MHNFFSLNPIERILLAKFIMSKTPEISEENLLAVLIKGMFEDLTLNKLTNIPNFAKVENCLMILDSFDRVFLSILGKNMHIYVLGDEFINNPHETYLELLWFTGLIYRFNAATKFGYPKRKIMQTRLNGWGRDYCDKVISRHSEKYLQVYEKILDIADSNKKTYLRLVNLCNTTERPLNVDRIHELNENLPLKIVT